MDDAFAAYGAGHADGLAGRGDGVAAADLATGADYRAGLTDGQVAAFEIALIDAVRRALDPPSGEA